MHERPLFRCIRADGAACSLVFADDGTWLVLLDQKVVERGQTAGRGVEEAVEKFRALAPVAPQRCFAAAS